MENKEKLLEDIKQSINQKYVTIIILTCLLILTLGTLFYVLMVPKIVLNGQEKISLSYNDKYEEQGAFIEGEKDKLLYIDGNVDTKKVGNYVIKYKYKKYGLTWSKERMIEVKDEKSPDLKLKGLSEVKICSNKSYQEEGYYAKDEYEGDLTDKVKVETKDDKIIYSVEDSSGNKTTVIRKIIKEDKVNPVITLKGNSINYIVVGSNYKEQGAKAFDNCDGDLTSKITTEGKVDINKVGKYTIKYKVVDSSGNKSVVDRIINVISKNESAETKKNPGVIYLTFDDGPRSGTTDKILDILKEEGVSATFFVTMAGPDSLIKRAYEEGHTIALHTASHNYKTVYSSVNGYFNDLNRVSQRVERITGKESKIIRFPGGSSNTVSRKYNNGIMSILTKETVNRGYRYYDWNISSGDAGETTSPKGVYNNVTKNLSKKRANMVLMHDIKPYTRDALRDIIRYGKQNGYTFEKITASTPMITQRVNN